MTTARDARKQVKRDRAFRRLRYNGALLGDVDRAALETAVAKLLTPEDDSILPKGFPTGDVHRWVPIGPSVVTRGQANGRPRVTGRVRDLAISDDGRRVYAGSAMGGVWYSDDAGLTWRPVGGWADRAARAGGDNNAQSCGCLLVDFDPGGDAGRDFVMVGTGEATPASSATGNQFGGLGVLSARGPVAAALGANPWEPETGLTDLEGLGMYRLVRRPGRTPGATGAAATRDEVLAATSSGLYLGTRAHVATAPAHDEFTWTKLPGIDLVAPPAPLADGTPGPTPAVTDLLWLTGGPSGRIVVAISAFGLAFSDNLGQTFTPVPGASTPGTAIVGRGSFAMVPGTNRLYMLTALPTPAGAIAPQDDDPCLLRVPDITVGAPTASRVNGVPLLLWPAQRDYDQAIAAQRVGTNDRIYLGGSYFDLTQADFGASLWCFDVSATGATLGAASGVSRMGSPPGGDGADVLGHIGNNVHADVHVVRVVGTGTNRQVWVGCDGGVYLSTQSGRVNTFAPRSTGLASLMPGFLGSHPTSSQYVVGGFQDNGTQARVGDTVWEEIFVGDGGGIVIHPTATQYVVGQYVNASWSSSPPAGFVAPTSKRPGGGLYVGDREDINGVSAFYSGASAVPNPAGGGRIALGTSRVWLTDDLGTAATNTWRVLPYPNGMPQDPRPLPIGGAAPSTDPPALQAFGVPAGGALGAVLANAAGPLGGVTTVKWVTAHEILVLFGGGVVRWVENPTTGRWTATVVFRLANVAGVLPGRPLLTDLAPIPGTHDFYVTTAGSGANPTCETCAIFTGGQLRRTRLREALPAQPGLAQGPLEPAYSVAVDPATPADVYVGTVTGVWKGRRTGVNNVAWTPFVNGLPQASVQDLSVWHDPVTPGAPRMLRAAVQARGVWEVDLAAATEPVRTYLRVHAHDDRRRFPTPMANPRRPATGVQELAYASPDIVVRPRAGAATAPRWPGGTLVLDNTRTWNYQLWTFQTAFRWIYPSVVPDGRWSDAFGDLVELHRDRLRATIPTLAAGRFVDRLLWDAVVGTRIDAGTGAVSTNAADPLAVYRPAWQGPGAMNAVATEVDLLETVVPRSVTAGVWNVFSERSTVDVLLHHRDSRPVPELESFVMLLWRSDPNLAALLRSDATAIEGAVSSMLISDTAATVADWRIATTAGSAVIQRLPVSLDARAPRAVPIDVDLSTVPRNHFVLFLGIGASEADLCSAPIVTPPAVTTVAQLVRQWPYAAMRVVSCSPRT